jgi:hypothetical protein
MGDVMVGKTRASQADASTPEESFEEICKI